MLQEVSESFLAADASAFNRARVLSASGFRSWRQVFIRDGGHRAQIHYNAAPLRWAWILYRRVLRALNRRSTKLASAFSNRVACSFMGLSCGAGSRARRSPTCTNPSSGVAGVAAFALIFELIYRSRSMC